jgi:capsular polysaccharide biosynthesis protein
MELRGFWNVLVRWKWVVVLVTGASVIASGVLAVIAPPGYKAQTIISFSAPAAGVQVTLPGLDEQNRLLAAEQVVEDFTKIVPTYGFAEGVAKRLPFPASPQQIEKVWTVKKQARHLLSIEAHGATEAEAVAYAKAAADEINDNGQAYYKDLNTGGMQVAIADPAHSEGLSGRLLDFLFVIARVVSGFIVGVGLAFLLNYLDDHINTADDAEALGLRVIGAIPRHTGPMRAAKARSETSSKEPQLA